jgi:hypothetical protein
MMIRQRLNALSIRAIIIVALSLTSYYIGVWAATSPTIPRTGTGGNIGPCTWYVSLDGTTPVAEAMVQVTALTGTTYNPGDNLVGTAGQDFAAFLDTNLIAANEQICLSAQTFTIKSQVLTVAASNIEIIGRGPDETVIQQANGANLAVDGLPSIQKGLIAVGDNANPYNNIAFMELTLDFNKAGQTGSYTCPNAGWGFAVLQFVAKSRWINFAVKNTPCQAFEVSNSKNNMFQNGRFTGDWQAYFLTGGTQNNVITGDWIFSPLNDGIEEETGSGIAANNTITNCYISNAGNSAILVGGDGTSIIGNTFISPAFAGVTLDSTIGSIVANNMVLYSGQSGIVVASTAVPGRSNNNIISGNNVTHSGTTAGTWYGIQVNGNAGAVTVSNNIVSFSKSTNIQIDGDSNAIVNGNIAKDSQAGHGIVINGGADNIVTSNRAYDDQASKTQSWGIIVQPGTTNTIIANNDVTGNTNAAGILDNAVSGTVYIRTNVPYNPVGKITNFINSAFIGACGSGTTLVSTTVYVVCGTDLVLTCSGGTVTAVTEQDNLGNTVNTEASCSNGITNNPFAIGVWMPVGWKITFTFTGAPTVTVYAN